MKASKLVGLLLMMAVLVPTVSAIVMLPVEPEPEPDREYPVTLTTTIINPHLRYVWDGRQWILNPNVTITVIGNRTYVRYGAWP